MDLDDDNDIEEDNIATKYHYDDCEGDHGDDRQKQKQIMKKIPSKTLLKAS